MQAITISIGKCTIHPAVSISINSPCFDNVGDRVVITVEIQLVDHSVDVCIKIVVDAITVAISETCKRGIKEIWKSVSICVCKTIKTSIFRDVGKAIIVIINIYVCRQTVKIIIVYFEQTCNTSKVKTSGATRRRYNGEVGSICKINHIGCGAGNRKIGSCNGITINRGLGRDTKVGELEEYSPDSLSSCSSRG